MNGSSKQIEQRTVEMQFNNQNFEKNVSQSVSTLDKLKQSLNLTGAAKGLESINQASRNNDISALGRAAESVSIKFQAMQIMAITALANITNRAITAGINITKALTIDPIKTGLNEYELKIDSIKTILSNTAKNGTTLDDVSKALNELNEYSDKTIYNFAQMTNMVGKFSATSGNLESSVNIVKGLSNLAAEAGVDNTRLQSALYQTSQAMSGAYFQAMDWMSLENAGIATRNFKDDIYEMAIAMGTLTQAQKEAIDSGEMRFNDSLSKLGWLTTDVFAAVTTNYANDEAMTKAAGEVTTFTKLVSVLTETVQSGWAQTFELIIGNYEEAKQLFTDVNNFFAEIINRSSDARNDVLKEWKTLGGRNELIESFQNIGKAIGAIISPITEAYRTIFPRTTGEQLYTLTEKFKLFTEKLIINGDTAEKIKNIFTGLFGAINIVFKIVLKSIDIFIQLAKALWPIGDAILNILSGLGFMVGKFSEATNESGFLTKAIRGIESAISFLGTSLKNFFVEFLKFDSIMSFFGTTFAFIRDIALAIGKVLGELIRGGDLQTIMELINTGILGGLLWNMKNVFSNISSFGENIKKVLISVKNVFVAWQNEIYAKTLLNIAKAVGILAVSLLILALIPEEKITSALVSLGTVMIQFMLLYKAFNASLSSIPKGAKLIRASLSLIALSTSMVIMASALKILSGLNFKDVFIGLIGMAGGMLVMINALKAMPNEGRMIRSSMAMILLGTSLNIMAVALNNIGSLPLVVIGKSLIAIASSLFIINKFMNSLPASNIGNAFSMIILTTSLVILGEALEKLGSLTWEQIGKSLIVMSGSLFVLSQTLAFMNKNNHSSMGNATSMVVMTTSLLLLGKAMEQLGSLSWTEITKALTSMTVAVTLLAISANVLKKSGGVGLTLVGASIGLLLFAGGMKALSTLSWTDIIKGFTGLMTGVLGLVIAAKLLSPVAGTLLIVTGACALFSLAIIGVGVGLVTISSGIGALAVALAGGATAIVAGLAAILIGIIGLVPEIIKIVHLALLGLVNIIIEISPLLAKALGTLVLEALKMLRDYIPQIVGVIIDLLIDVIRVVSDRVPELLVSIAELLQAIFKGFIEAFNTLDPKIFLEGSKALLILTGAFILMATLASVAPMALLGVLAFGVLLLELSLVLQLVNKLFGDNALNSIAKAGDTLLAIGTAIGKFIGGIIGGIGVGITNAMPTIATNLSLFMKELQPFINGASSIDPSILLKIGILSAAIIALTAANFVAGIGRILSIGGDLPSLGSDLSKFMINSEEFIKSTNSISSNMIKGVKAITEAIIMLTAANLLKGITSFFTGKSSFEDFSKEIIHLGVGMNKFVKSLGTFSNSQVKTIDSACSAIISLANASKKIPNEGGVWGWLAGDNSLGKFSGYLPDLGTNLNKFITNLGTFNEAQVLTIDSAGKAIIRLAEASKEIPNEGGVWGWLAGDNSLSTFSDKLPKVATDLKSFTDNLGTFNEAQVLTVDSAGKAITALANAAKNIPAEGGIWQKLIGEKSISAFSGKLPSVGKDLNSFIKNLGTFNDAQLKTVTAAGNAIKNLALAAQDIPNEDGLWQKIVGDKSIATFGDKLPSVGTNLNKFVTNLGTFNEAQVVTSDCAGRAIAALAQAANTIPSEGSWLDKILGTKDIESFSTKLPAVGANIKLFTDNLGTFNEAQVVSSDCAGRAISALASAAEQIPAEGGWLQPIVGHKDIEAFSSKLPNVATGLKGFVNNLGTFTEEQVTTVGSAATALVSLAEAGSKIASSGGVFQIFTGEKDLGAFASDLGTVGTGLSSFMKKLSGIDTTNVDAVDSAMNALEKIIKYGNNDIDTEKVTSIMTAAGNSLDTLGTSISSFTTSMKNVSDDDISNALNNFEQVFHMVTRLDEISGDNLETISKEIGSFGENIQTGFVDSFSGTTAKTKVKDGVADLVIDTTSAFETKRRDIVDKFKSIINETIRVLDSSEMLNNIKEAGKYFAQGFANGINDNRYLVVDAGSALGNSAYDAAKKAIDAHSPSRKSFELGTFFGQGFANALGVYNKKVYDESYMMGTEASNGLNSSISKMNNMFDDTMSNPTIKPILDLSNIENGSKIIDNLFNNPAIGATLDTISASMNNNNQNGANDELVSAINKLGSNLSGTGDTYNINGITYGSESDVSTAIGTLIRAANIERRT